jgi:hypothetical protein
VHNHVLDPASLLVNRRAKSAKTDRIDVERMQRKRCAGLTFRCGPAGGLMPAHEQSIRRHA